MNTREEQIKLSQKMILKLRAMHEDLIYVQKLSDTLKLDMSEIKIPLYAINFEIRKYHDAARDLERDLDESQQDHFVLRENSMMIGEGI